MQMHNSTDAPIFAIPQAGSADLSRMSAGELAGLYEVFRTLGSVLNGYINQPRFAHGENDAGMVIDGLTEYCDHMAENMIHAIYKRPASPERSELIIRHEANNGATAAEIAALAASLAVGARN